MGNPSILIPYPYAAENHQEYNAKILEKNGAAKVLLEANISSDTLNGLLEVLINDENKLLKMGANARRLAILDVEDRIYVEIKKLLKGKI
jgi:UDP-N-acetylglucosamine--N-acetylmuramyl-(pentapeptide) pyrophosphoryl-undecaprenol N-acetylglucosamine transferase